MTYDFRQGGGARPGTSVPHYKGGAKEGESRSTSLETKIEVTPRIANRLLRALYSHGVNNRLAERGTPVMPVYQVALLQETKARLATGDKKEIRDRNGDDMLYFWGKLIKEYANCLSGGFNTEARPDGTWVSTNQGDVLVQVVKNMGTVCTVKLTNPYEKSEARFGLRGGLLDEPDPFTIDCQQSNDPSNLKIEGYRVEFHRGRIKMFSAQDYKDGVLVEIRYSFD